MAFFEGTADNHKDLLSEIVTFVTNPTNGSDGIQGDDRWTVLASTLTGDGEHVAVFSAPGLSGTDTIYTAIETVSGPNYFNFKLTGMDGYNAALSIDNQVNAQSMYLTLDSISFPFQLAGDGDHLRILARVSTVDVSGYLGFARRMNDVPSVSYPYPLVVGGNSTSSTLRWQDTTASIMSYWKSNVALRIRNRFGNWESPSIWPRSLSGLDESSPYVSTQFNLIPTILFSATSGQLAELHGMYWVSSTNNQSGFNTTINTVEYEIIQNIFRTGDGELAAMRKD